jgi:putative spermidine/putrescine transport system permease protein
LIVPLGVVTYYSLQPSDVISGVGDSIFANYLYFLSKPHYVKVITRTLGFSVITTLISVSVGYGASFVLRNISRSIGSIAILVLTFPILSGPIVTVLGWMIMLTSGGTVGQILTFFQTTFGWENLPTRLLGTNIAVIIGMVHFNLPFVILNLFDVMLKIDPVLEEAAMNLGANRRRVFFKVILPLSLPGILSASLISFALAMNAFVNPSYLGNTSRLVLTTQISQFMRTTYNWQLASATGVILLLISLVIITFYNHFLSRMITSGRK